MGLIRRIRFWGINVVEPNKIEEELENLAGQAARESGVTTTFTTADTPAKTVTVVNGIITKVE